MEIDINQIRDDIKTTCKHPPQLTRRVIIQYIEFIGMQETERRTVHEQVTCMRCGKIPIDTTNLPQLDIIEIDEKEETEETDEPSQHWNDTTKINKTILDSVIDKLET